MSLADQKLDTMPVGAAARLLGVAADGTPVLVPWAVLAQSAVAVSHTGDLVETVLATVTIPAGAMRANGAVRVSSLWTYTNSANNKRMRVKLGGVGGTAFFDSTQTTTATYTDPGRTIQNRNSEASQVGRPAASTQGSTTSAVVTSAIDTSVAQTIVFTALLANTGETITLESYLVEIMPAP